jgi:isoprenylcysteine carboxyl methyltransferase (ICMT) family protein YpbQ
LLIFLSNRFAFAPYLDASFQRDLTVELIGTVITLMGSGFAVWAGIHLGEYWSGRVTIKVGHKFDQKRPLKNRAKSYQHRMAFRLLWTAIVVGELRGLLATAIVLIGLL